MCLKVHSFILEVGLKFLRCPYFITNADMYAACRNVSELRDTISAALGVCFLLVFSFLFPFFLFFFSFLMSLFSLVVYYSISLFS